MLRGHANRCQRGVEPVSIGRHALAPIGLVNGAAYTDGRCGRVDGAETRGRSSAQGLGHGPDPDRKRTPPLPLRLPASFSLVHSIHDTNNPMSTTSRQSDSSSRTQITPMADDKRPAGAAKAEEDGSAERAGAAAADPAGLEKGHSTERDADGVVVENEVETVGLLGDDDPYS